MEAEMEEEMDSRFQRHVLEMTEIFSNVISGTMDNNADKVRFTEHGFTFVTKYESCKLQQLQRKTLEYIDEIQEEASASYHGRNFLTAIEHFNRIICFAPKGSEELSKAYFNRSAAFFAVKRYDLSLSSVKLARESGSSEDLLTKLDAREEKCVKKMNKMNKKKRFIPCIPELSYPPHENPLLSFIASCLEVKTDDDNRLLFVANTDLKIGDILAIERPFCSVVTNETRYICCTNCLRENDLNLIPCPNCHSAMFCSEKCYAEAYEAFHDIECPIMDPLLDLNLIDLKIAVVIRVLILATKRFKSSDDFIQFVKDADAKDSNELNEGNDLLASMLKLAQKLKAAPVPLMTLNPTTATIIYRLLLDYTNFKDKFTTNEHVDFLIDLIFQLTKIISFKPFLSSKAKEFQLVSDIYSTNLERSCVGIYPFKNLLKRSDQPNIAQIKHGANNVFIVNQPIKKGEEIVDSFGFFNYSWNYLSTRSQKEFPMFTDHDFIKINKELIPKYSEFLTTNQPENRIHAAKKILAKCWDEIYADEIPLAKKIEIGFI